MTFKAVELEFDQGLVVFSGPSGAGKSVLMSAILSTFGYPTKGAASLCEVRIKKPSHLHNELFVMEEELTLKTLKKEKLRYFIEGQNASRKVLQEMFSPYVKYLSVRDKSGFESETLIKMIDNVLCDKDKAYKKSLKEYKKRYLHYKSKVILLKKVQEDEKKLAELREFSNYEIEKINRINPKIDEEIALMKVKQQLSRIDKIKDALTVATGIFRSENAVEEVYRLLDKDMSMFSEMMNQLRADFEETELLAEELEEINVEEVLDRLSDLAALKSRYGSIEEALVYRDMKVKELTAYQTIEQNKSMLESFLEVEFSELMIISSRLSYKRKKAANLLEKQIERHLKVLKLPKMQFYFEQIDLYEYGLDRVDISLGHSKTDTLSGGEFNRVRLALMAVTLSKESTKQGILILDEIDANVSGDESIAIAEMISTLSAVYQVFAISHQPHLSAQAKQHIVVRKKGKVSVAEILSDKGRVQEIARIIAGENPTTEALEFAKRLRNT